MINKVILVGRLTKEISLKKTSSNLSVASFTVACNRRVSGQNEQTADFINCVAWRQSADFLAKYSQKGSLVGVEGRIQTRNYDDASGKRVYVTEIVCDSVQLLDSKTSSTNTNRAPSQENDYSFSPSVDVGYESSSAHTGFEAPTNNTSGSNDSFADFSSGNSLDISSDDLPF